MVELATKSSRSRFLTFVLAALFLLIVGKLIHLQVFSYDYYTQISEENRIRILPKTAMRGKIVDRYGRLLASDRPAYTVSIIPSEANNLPLLASQLSPLLQMDDDRIIKKVRERRSRKYEPIPIQQDLAFPAVCVIEESNELFPGVIYQLNHARYYPYGNISAHLVGYTGEVDEDEAKAQYRLGSMIGRAGVEKEYDQQLRGMDGIDYYEVAATGRIIGFLEDKPNKDPLPGDELGLTIDLDLQQLADSLFGDTLSGAAIFIDPRNGEVLAMVSLPDYDANLFSGFVPADDYQRLINDKRRPLFDRTIRGTYPPGSTFKLLTAGAGLELGMVTPQTRFKPCYGGFQYGRRFFRCYKRSGHGDVNLMQAIEESCDTYFYQLGLKIGLDNFSDYAHRCGIDEATGIDLPGEKTGFVPDRDWYMETYGKYGWTNAVMLNLAIGQGEMLVTPLGLAEFYCGLANHGVEMTPHLKRYMLGPGGDTVWTSPEVRRTLPFSKETLKILHDAAVMVVQGENGTARASRLPDGIEMGGKTGTAQNPHGNEHAWFVGFAPADNPAIVGVVLAEQAGHGSSVAAPIVKQVFIRYLQKHGYLAPPLPEPIDDVAKLPDFKVNDEIPIQ